MSLCSYAESAAKVNQGQKQAFNESHVSKANNENEEGDDSDYDDDSWGRDDGWDDDDGGNAQVSDALGCVILTLSFTIPVLPSDKLLNSY